MTIPSASQASLATLGHERDRRENTNSRHHYAVDRDVFVLPARTNNQPYEPIPGDFYLAHARRPKFRNSNRINKHFALLPAFRGEANTVLSRALVKFGEDGAGTTSACVFCNTDEGCASW
jgi:hypothetical protein